MWTRGRKSGSARIWESRGPENGVSRWLRPNSDIYSQNDHFGLVYDMIYQFLGEPGRQIYWAKLLKYFFWIVMPTFRKSCHRPKTEAKLDSQANFPEMAATRPARGRWAEAPENLPVSDSGNMFNIS